MMNSNIETGTINPTDQQIVEPEPQPQIHPKLQAEVVQSQPEPVVQAPAPAQLHPALESQLRPEAQAQLEPQASTQPQVQLREAQIPASNFTSFDSAQPAEPQTNIQPQLGQVPIPASNFNAFERYQAQPEPLASAQPQVQLRKAPMPAANFRAFDQAQPAEPQPQARLGHARIPASSFSTFDQETSTNEQTSSEGINPTTLPNTNTNSAVTVDAVAELQEKAKLAESRVRLLDTTIDILLTTFKNKYDLDKALEKECAKLLKATEFETSDKSLKENLQILAGSTHWVQEHLQQLEEFMHEKRVNVQIAGPLVDSKRERKKEEKQILKIEKVASKIGERAMNREAKEENKRMRETKAKMVEESWIQIS